VRARALALAVLGSAAVLLVGWEAGTHVASPAAAPAPTSRPPQRASGADASPAPSAPSAGAPSATAVAGPSGTFPGRTVTTQYGPVQVAVVVKDGRIADVRALQLTNQGGRSVQISANAAPQLRVEALKAQSAKIDAVSGATYTSEGYRTSLQSAIDAARR
jgi:uncharacterized protein with FMN-binding domain